MTPTEPEGAGKSRRRPPRTPPPLLPRNYGDYDSWPKRFKERRKLLSKLPAGDVRDDALSMCSLDEDTDPKHRDLKGKPNLGRAIAELAVYLLFRSQHRAAWALRDRPFSPPAEEAGQRQRAELVEPCFHAALVRAFPPPHPGLPFDRRRFERAFTRFSAGELGMQKLLQDVPAKLALDGTPDGIYHVCFAEAALLFLRFGLEPEFWRLTLPAFTAGTATFAMNHWSGVARTLDAYGPAHLTLRMTGAATLAAMRLYYGAMELPQLLRSHGALLATMLRDEPRLPHVIPIPEEFR